METLQEAVKGCVILMAFALINTTKCTGLSVKE